MLMFTMVGLGWAGLGGCGQMPRYLGRRVMSPLAWSLWSQGATLLVESGLTFAMLIALQVTALYLKKGPGFQAWTIAFDSLLEDQA